MQIALALALLAAPASGDPFAAKIVAGHTWIYDVAITHGEGTTVWAFTSQKPTSEDKGGKTFLRFAVTQEIRASAEDATAELEARLAKADPNTGLSYAWDVLFVDGSSLWHLDAPCLYSKANVDTLARNLRAATLEGRQPERAFSCACGFGCERTAPAKVSAGTLDEKGVEGAKLRAEIERALRAAGWEVVADEASAAFAVRPRVQYAGMKTVLALDFVRLSDKKVLATETTGASGYVMHEVAADETTALLKKAARVAP